MRKSFYISVQWIFVCICSLLLVSCAKSEDTVKDNSVDTGNLESSIVGKTWYVIWESEELIEIEGLTLNLNGTFFGYELKRRSSDNFSKTSDDTYKGSYNISGNKLILREDDGDTYTYFITAYDNESISMLDESGDNETYYCLEKGKTLYDVMKRRAELHQEKIVSDNGNNGSSNSGSNNNGGSNNNSTDPKGGKVTGTIKAIGPGVYYSNFATLANGKTTTVDYVYYPTTGKYYIYGGSWDSSSNANGGKGLRYDAQKGYNSIKINAGSYFDSVMKVKYDWELRLHVTIP